MSFRVFVEARQADTMITGAFSNFSGTVLARSVIAMREVVGAKHVLEWAGIAKASRSHAEADVLSKDARCNIHRERRHIRIDWHTTLLCTLDVSRIIEQPLPFESDCTRVELTVATHARSPWPDNVRTPSSISHLSTIEGIYGNATIDNRDEVRVGQRVEYSPWPGTVNAAKDQVVIEC